jgi:hypothetical protein
LTQKEKWPPTGQQILAQYDDDFVVVYQAYRPAIGNFAASYGYFGGEFSLNRMSWIKPNFLWMMYRSGWGTKPGQEVILAIWLQRSAFNEILSLAVPSQFVPELYSTRKEWQQAVKRSSVRLQWDPDHTPRGGRCARRAIQLGLRGEILAKYSQDWLVNIEDISEFVREQYRYVQDRDWNHLLTPSESVYPVIEAEIRRNLQISAH